MFTVTAGKGFHITFSNGWTASVQWGWGNYCENRSDGSAIAWEGSTAPSDISSATAECARWNTATPDEAMDEPLGWLSADEVMAFLAETAAL